MEMAKLILKPGREKSLLRRHPWVFSGAVAQVQGDPEAGATVEIRSADGRFLGWGAYSPRSQIVAQSLELARGGSPGTLICCASGWRMRWPRARGSFPRRRRCVSCTPNPTACRASSLTAMAIRSCCSCRALGAVAWRETLADQLLELTGAQRVYERSDTEVLALEGMQPRVGPLRGDPPPDPLVIEEDGLRFSVSVASGPQDRLLSRSARQPPAGALAGARRRACWTASATRAASRSTRSPGAPAA